MKRVTVPIMLTKAAAAVAIAFLVAGCADQAGQELFVHNSLAIDDEATFRQMVSEYSGPVLVKFASPTCSACIRSAPIFEAVAGEQKDKARFVSVDADKASKLADRYEVWRIPTVIAFDGGREVQRLQGVRTKQEYEAMVNALQPKH